MENKKASVSSCVRGVLHFLRPYRGKGDPRAVHGHRLAADLCAES